MIVDRSTTALVVDSTADLPDNLVQDPNPTLVPLTIFFGEEAYLDWVELLPEQLRDLILAVTDRRVHLRLPSLVGSVIGTCIGPKAVGLCFVEE